VPKTPVHKDYNAQLGKYEVRFAAKRIGPTPASDLMLPKESCQRQFRVLVALTFHGAHNF
jgi:hypothetical protein